MITTQTSSSVDSNLPLPLTLLEAGRHEQQQRCIRERADRIEAHDRNRYWFSSYLVTVKKERLWQRDPRYASLDFLDYIPA